MPVWLLLNWKWLASGAVSAIAACYLTSVGYRLTIAQMQRDQASAAVTAAHTALAQFTADAASIHASADEFTHVQIGLDASFGKISKDFHAAVKAHPLPLDCQPGAERLHTFANAIAATNTAAGLQPVAAVPGHP